MLLILHTYTVKTEIAYPKPFPIKQMCCCLLLPCSYTYTVGFMKTVYYFNVHYLSILLEAGS